MKASYTFSQCPIPVNTATTTDLILRFQEESKTSSRRPLNLCVVLDRSGSMSGKPLRFAIQAAQKLVDFLTPDDYFSLVIYDDQVETLLLPQLASDPAAIRSKIGKIRARGLTNLSGGWLQGCAHVQSNFSSDRLNRVILLTDGLANVGTTKPKTLVNTARDQAENGIITTTLGFGDNFNEDLLIDMADAAGGNFYYIQSPEDALDVFRIEMESLVSVVAQNLTVTLTPETGVRITDILNNYRRITEGDRFTVFLGDVYGGEGKPLAVGVSLPEYAKTGEQKLLSVTYQYQSVEESSKGGVIQQRREDLTVTLPVATPEDCPTDPDYRILERTSQLRMAKAKEEAVSLADKGDYKQASEKLREAIAALQQKVIETSFTVAEEIAQLEHYAETLTQQRFNPTVRKEMRDQSYQSLNRDRADLQLRGAAGSASSLEAISDPQDRVLLKCEKIGGKLRIRVISDGYNSDLNVQFPRSIRENGVTYVADKVELVPSGNYYRAVGKIRRLVKPGEEHAGSPTPSKPQNLKSAKVQGTINDLETTDTVGDGVLVQCLKDGKKLRVRVVSDGYDPDYNMRFPRSIREEGEMYVVDGVKEASGGNSYIALGKIRRFVQ
ncbi:VWA domain-containing protein [Spirulina sp. CS-785/01]|uniref:VWA domain-containing protein n=1 Tax=Spirulina sp. CS-785/01 TaxID=3021716 RepID=UPI00232B63BE|nr:VWA domain-containing protein [Spirulina sp. CS-785/01]MDB9312810.1 VWA domain-containing protein [Spirulina sp. CS-785/01]